MINFLNYSGNKSKFVKIINSFINQTHKRIYIEPFLGSGCIFLNLEKEFDQYILNDLDGNLIKIFNAFKNSSFKIFQEMEKECIINRNIKENKSDFYDFRNFVNSLDKDLDEYAFGLYFLFNSCINSKPRFGPNGFNASFGARFKTVDKVVFDIIKSKLNRACLNNTDFFKLVPDIPQNSILFLDPPYIERPTNTYNNLSRNLFSSLTDYIKNTNNDIIYTDIEHDYLSDMKYVILRDKMKHTSPICKNKNYKREAMFIKIQ